MSPGLETGSTERVDHTFSAGVRVVPFREPRWETQTVLPYRYFVPTSIYVEATVGVEVRDCVACMMPSDRACTVAPNAGLAVARVPMQGHDYAFGLKLRGQTSVGCGDAEAGISLTGVIQLYH